MKLLFFIVSFLASSIGSICGIGGGIIIKPVLDFTAVASLAAIGFYSCCTVLSMSAYNVFRTLGDRNGSFNGKTGTFLATGAAIGGILGNRFFTLLKESIGKDGIVGASQALLLLLLTVGTLFYTLKKDKIQTKHIENISSCLFIGLSLGCVSSFLGIGGGPFNLVVLHYFFGMDSKKAVSNSLYIILFSQIANLLMYFIGNRVPDIDLAALILMVVGGIGGGIVGRKVNRKISNEMVDKLFIGLLTLIILLCIYNAIRYLNT